MKWYQAALTYVATANMIVMPTLAHAQNFGSYNIRGYQDANAIAAVAPPAFDANTFSNNPNQSRARTESPYKMTLEYNKKAVLRDASQAIVMEAPFGEREQLRRFEPTVLNAALAKEMAKVKASGKAAYAHSIKALPTESAIFFMAMGAVVAGQLLLDYSANPLAMQQHIDHHMSPLGTFGFFTFMLSQGVTSNMLSMYIKNPKFHFMIPYMGMAVGAFTQSYLTQFMADPNVMACGKDMMGIKPTEKELSSGVDPKPCSKAYEYLVINKKIWEFAPGMISVVLSAGMAAGAQWALTKTILITRGIDIGMYLMPGKMQLTGLRMLLVKGLQIGAFGAVDLAINRWVTLHWKNAVDGNDFHDMNRKLVTEINAQKKSGWQNTDKNAEKELKHFNKKMSEWRMMNMAEVYESHQIWSENIQRLMQMYNSSEAFYKAFTDQVRHTKYKQNSTEQGNEGSLLNTTYPFNGVVGKNIPEDKQDLYYTHPHASSVYGAQMVTISDTVEYIDSLYAEKKLAQVIVPYENTVIREIRARLDSTQEESIVLGLQTLNRAMTAVLRQGNASRPYYEALYNIRAKLGAPVPMMEEGRGFLASYEKAPDSESVVKGIPYYKYVGKFATPQLTDYFLMQMVCGADYDKRQSSVIETKGYYTLFVPPSLRYSSHDFSRECENISLDVPRDSSNIYSQPITQGGKYKGFLNYIKDNIRPEILGPAEASNFPAWWKTHTEPQMIKAFETYEQSYTEVIAKLIKAVNTSEIRSSNLGPMANGAFDSILQEQRIYLAILEDMLVPAKEFKMAFMDMRTQGPKTAIGKKIEQQFRDLHMIFNIIKIGKQNGKTVLLSDLENYDFENQLKEIQESLSELAKMLGANKKSDAPDAKPEVSLVQTTEEQKQLVTTALEGLQSIGMEMMMYGTIANAVTWSKIRNLKAQDLQAQAAQNETTKRKLEIMSGVSARGGRH